MLNLSRLQDKKIYLASAKHSEIDIKSEGKVLNLRLLRNRKIFVTSERSNVSQSPYPFVVVNVKHEFCRPANFLQVSISCQSLDFKQR